MMLHAPPLTKDILLARNALKAMHERFPAGYPTLTWILPDAGFSMDSEARTASATITQEFASAIVAQGTLIEGSGFQAATVRAIISGIDMMARTRAPRKVFAELPPCIEWCARNRPAPAAPPAPELRAALEATRATFR